MILLSDLISYLDSIKNRIPSIHQVLLATNEAELADLIKEIENEGIILISIIPSAKNVGADCDNINEESILLFYLVQKLEMRNYTHAEFLNKLGDMQLLMRNFKQILVSDKAHDICPNVVRYIETQGWNQDPEYNLLGCYGWSLSLRSNATGL